MFFFNCPFSVVLFSVFVANIMEAFLLFSRQISDIYFVELFFFLLLSVARFDVCVSAMEVKVKVWGTMDKCMYVCVGWKQSNSEQTSFVVMSIVAG